MKTLNKATLIAATLTFLQGHNALRLNLLESFAAEGIIEWADAKPIAMEAIGLSTFTLKDGTTIKGIKVVRQQRGDAFQSTSPAYNAAKQALYRVSEAFRPDAEGKAVKQAEPIVKLIKSMDSAKKAGITYSQALRALNKLYNI